MADRKLTTSAERGASLHEHTLELPDGEIPAGTYTTGEAESHTHRIVFEDDLDATEHGNATTVRTTEDGVGPHAHTVVIPASAAVAEEDEAAEIGAEDSVADADRQDEYAASGRAVETKRLGGRAVEVKQSERNGVPVGIVAGYIATWDPDTGGIFGVPDRFEQGAFSESLNQHRSRGNRPIRLKDHHGRTIGGFPLDAVREDGIGLYGVGEINLETQQGREAFSLARQGVLSDFSIGFVTLADRLQGSPPSQVRVISKAAIVEGSIVDEPANPAARILEVKGKLSAGAVKAMTAREIESVLIETGAFSRGAAKFLAGRLAAPEIVVESKVVNPAGGSHGARYDSAQLESILANLRGAREALA
jgi:HK97 family phage prohead protease